jgi:hypothetical protein
MKLDNAGRVTGQSISGSIWQHCSRAGTGKEARAQAESIDASGPQILIQISAAGNMGNLRQVTLYGRAAVPSSGRFWRRLLLVIPFGVTVASTGLRFKAGRQEVAEEK